MAGHSKWANIQHRKKAQDAKRGKLFTKLIREIVVAAQMGGGDPDANPRLRAAIDKSLGANMTRDTVERAIKRGAGGGDGDDVVELVYEGYGPSGVAILVEAMTDNRNRTAAEVRHAFGKHGGNLGAAGSVAYLFNRVGLISFAPGTDEDTIMDIAIEAGADDVVTYEDGSIDVQTTLETFGPVQDALEKAELTSANAEMTMIASTETELDQDGAEKLMRLVDRLEDLDDTQEVYTNADISEQIMSTLG